MQGTSRGGADIKEIVRRLSLWGVNMLFVGERTLLCCRAKSAFHTSGTLVLHLICTTCAKSSLIQALG